LTQLKPGERRSWTIFLEAIDSLDDVKPRLAALTRAPMIEAERYTLAEGEKARVTVWSSGPVQLQVYSPSRSNNPVGYMKMVDVQPAGSGVWRAEFTPKDGRGAYTLDALGAGKTSEACVYVRQPWSWYLQRAREEALNKPQKASTHRESWVGC